MLERMRDILERIDDLNSSFRGMAHRHFRRQKQTFNDLVTQAQNAPATPQNAPPAGPKPPGLSPLAAPSPAIRPTADPVTGLLGTQPPYGDLIRKYAELNGLSPNLVRQVIRTESNFDPRCVSQKGAKGLMQLMPETARELGVEDPFDPEQNIAGGSKYLAMMLDRFGGNLTRALAAYNAGPTAVQSHGGMPPFPETKRFVAKVLGKTDR